MLGQRRVLEGTERLLDLGEVVFRQITAVRARVGQGLVLFVKGLGDAERALGAEAEAAVGLALERGQIVEEGRELRGGLLLLGDGAGPAANLVPDGFGLGLIEQPLGAGVLVGALAESRVEPAAVVLAGPHVEIRVDLEIRARFEGADPLVALDQDGQRRRLHAADGRELEAAELGVERRHGPRGVDAHQPVALGAGKRGLGQRHHVLVAPQVVEGVADGFRGHGLEPQAADGLLGAGELGEVAEDEFALAAGVAGVDDLVHVLAGHQALEQLEAALAPLVNRGQLELVGDDGQGVEGPLPRLASAALDDALRLAQLDQVADGGGDDVAVVLEVVVLLFEGRGRGRGPRRRRAFRR